MLQVEEAGDVLAITATDLISREDYTDVLMPAVERMIEQHGSVKLLYCFGPEFKSMTVGAMWNDAKLGAMHLGEFWKIAVVTDEDFIRAAVRLFAPFIPAPVMIYAYAELDAARNWINQPAD